MASTDEQRTSGLWWRPSDGPRHSRIPGELHWSAGRPPLLDLVDAPTPTLDAGTVDDEPWLGRVSGFGSVTLVNPRESGIHIGGTINRRLVADYGLLGCHVPDPDEEWVVRVRMSHDLLPNVFRPPAAEHVSTTIADRKKTYEIDEGITEWTIDDIAVRIVTATRFTAKEDWGFEIASATPTISLTAPSAHSVQWWLETWLRPLHGLLSLASGRAGASNWIKLYRGDTPDEPLQNESEAVKLIGRGVGAFDVPRPPSRERIMPYRLIDADGQSFRRAMGRVRHVSERHRVALSFVDEILQSPERSLESKYLDGMRALERLHSDLRGEGPVEEAQALRQRGADIHCPDPTSLGPRIDRS